MKAYQVGCVRKCGGGEEALLNFGRMEARNRTRVCSAYSLELCGLLCGITPDISVVTAGGVKGRTITNGRVAVTVFPGACIGAYGPSNCDGQPRQGRNRENSQFHFSGAPHW